MAKEETIVIQTNAEKILRTVGNIILFLGIWAVYLI